MPKKRILQGTGSDGFAFDVVKDKVGYIIKCGLQKRTSIRLPSNITESEIDAVAVCTRLSTYLASKAPGGSDNIEENYNELAFSSTNDEEVSSNVDGMIRKSAEDLAVEEARMFAGDVCGKRSRDPRDMFTYTKEEVGSHFSNNRDYIAERQTCEDNKRICEARDRTVSLLLEQRDSSASKYMECEKTLRGVLETVFLNLGGASSLEALPFFGAIGDNYPETLSILEELERDDIQLAKKRIAELTGGTLSFFAMKRGFLMSRKQYAKLRAHELAPSWSKQWGNVGEIETLRKKCSELDEELRSRLLTIRSLKGIINKLQKKVSSKGFDFFILLSYSLMHLAGARRSKLLDPTPGGTYARVSSIYSISPLS